MYVSLSMQQLYGPDGLAYELTDKQIHNREQSWDKYHTTIQQRPVVYERISTIRSPSPAARSRAGGYTTRNILSLRAFMFFLWLGGWDMRTWTLDSPLQS